MKWKVTEITRKESAYIVTVTRHPHVIKGIWNSNIVPVIGNKTYIELDINKILDDLEINADAGDKSSSCVMGEANVIVGLIESIDKDDLTHYMRIAVDCLIMIESHEVRLNRDASYALKVPVNSLGISVC